MAHRIEVKAKNSDTRAEVRRKKLVDAGFFGIKDVELVDVYTIDAGLEESQLERVASILSQPVTQQKTVNQFQAPEKFNWAIEVGFLPGVTDNVANTARENIEDLLERKFEPEEGVYTSQVTFLSGELSRKDAESIASTLYNPIVERVHIKENSNSFEGMDIVVPKVRLDTQPTADIIDVLGMSDEELTILGKKGIPNEDGTSRGPLALDLTYMKAIQAYFKEKGRNPTDVEVESLAQTWSEHCKHTIFADKIDDIEGGLFKTFIKAATDRIRKEKGDKDFCRSVFVDNSGAIEFDENYLVTDKVETHNSPSALDPFGGAITGIVGVNRDAMGFGFGAKPIINRYGFCFADPKDKSQLYKGKNFTQKMLSSRRIMDGVVDGVNVGGNCSGIPTPQGFVFFDERYRGKPLVFVGTLGLIPKESAGRDSCEKKAQPGDLIVMTGGRVGADGIHGATFSSEALDSGSPMGAVQIGDPITQKKESDAIIKEARDKGLYNSTTDNGAGGLSCSVAEMAEEAGGARVELEKVPLKYPGLNLSFRWISESQERMTLAVPKEKINEFLDLMDRRKVEATVIGEFTDSGKCIVNYNGETVMDVDMDFLHNGLPPRPITTSYTQLTHEEPSIPQLEDLTETLHSMLGRLNIASFEFISQQFDHEVQGGSVIKPLQGRGRINGDATITRPVLSSKKGVITSHGINPTYSDIDTYHMAACAIDTTIRNVIAVGGNLEQLSLLDNFCWCSSDEPERLGQLKRAVKACYDYSVMYGTPFISGKDSMFNDFKGFDENGEPVKISVPPTLLVSSLGIIEDSSKAISLDAKIPGDLVYVLGDTHDELGGSEYFAMFGEQERGKKYVGNEVPVVDALRNKGLYLSLSECIDKGLVASAQSVHKGGLAVALAKTALGGMLGMDVSLENLHGNFFRDDFALFSESQGRLVVTVAPQYQKEFENIMRGNSFAQIGAVNKNDDFLIRDKNGKEIVKTELNDLNWCYKNTLGDY